MGFGEVTTLEKSQWGRAEVEVRVEKLKNGKATVRDGEMTKKGGDCGKLDLEAM